VEPHRLVHNGRRWYLAAWDGTRNDWRTFRVDRIQSKIASGARFTPRPAPDGDFATYVAKSVSYYPSSYAAKVKLHAPAEDAKQRIPCGAGELKPLDEHTCVLHTGASSLEMLSVYLGLIGYDFEVLEPPELVERVRLLASRYARSADPER